VFLVDWILQRYIRVGWFLPWFVPVVIGVSNMSQIGWCPINNFNSRLGLRIIIKRFFVVLILILTNGIITSTPFKIYAL
jgi:hypothetical protein